MNKSKKLGLWLFLALAALILFGWALDNGKLLADLLRTMLGILAPFLIGLVIAFILNVPMRAVERLLQKIPGVRSKSKLLWMSSFLITLVLFITGGALVFRIVLPELGATLATLGQQIPAFFTRLQQQAKLLEEWVPHLRDYIAELQLDWKEIAQRTIDFLQNGATSLLGSTMNIATSVFSGVFNTFMGFIFAVYILFGKEKLKVQARRVLYAWFRVPRADRIIYIADLTERTFSKFLTGQCFEAAILGMMFFISMSLLKFPYAMLVAVLVGVTALIPMFGAFIGCFVGAFLILVVNPIQAFWFVLLFLLLQQIEGNLIYPRVVGSSIGLPAMWVMVAVTVGGSTMGILGMLLMVPATSVLYALARENTERRLLRREVPPDRYAEKTEK